MNNQEQIQTNAEYSKKEWKKKRLTSICWIIYDYVLINEIIIDYNNSNI